MSQPQHYRSPFGDTTLTKVFVGGLAWETPTAVMRSYFEQFGNILEAVVINDKHNGKSKGYGFVTFGDPESARRAVAESNPVIDGRRANCNIASLGRRRSSPSTGRNHVGNPYQGGVTVTVTPPGGPPSHPFIQPPPVIYPPYGYTTYPLDYSYNQTLYSQQYYNQVYSGSPAPSSSYYVHSRAQHMQGPSYLYYPAQVGPSSLTYAPQPLLQPSRAPFSPSATDGFGVQTSIEIEAGPTTTASTNSSG